jgi:hypothetical protein
MLMNEKGIIHFKIILVCPEPGLNVLHLNPFTVTVPVIRGFFLEKKSRLVNVNRSNLNLPAGVDPSMYPAMYAGFDFCITRTINAVPSDLEGILITVGVELRSVLSNEISPDISFVIGLYTVSIPFPTKYSLEGSLPVSGPTRANRCEV